MIGGLRVVTLRHSHLPCSEWAGRIWEAVDRRRALDEGAKISDFLLLPLAAISLTAGVATAGFPCPVCLALGTDWIPKQVTMGPIRQVDTYILWKQPGVTLYPGYAALRERMDPSACNGSSD